jgi:hypothetical protein
LVFAEADVTDVVIATMRKVVMVGMMTRDAPFRDMPDRAPRDMPDRVRVGMPEVAIDVDDGDFFSLSGERHAQGECENYKQYAH